MRAGRWLTTFLSSATKGAFEEEGGQGDSQLEMSNALVSFTHSLASVVERKEKRLRLPSSLFDLDAPLKHFLLLF
jgi:hypothetical protein